MPHRNTLINTVHNNNQKRSVWTEAYARDIAKKSEAYGPMRMRGT